MAKWIMALIAVIFSVNLAPVANAETIDFVQFLNNKVSVYMQEAGQPTPMLLGGMSPDELEAEYANYPLSGIYVLGPVAVSNVQKFTYGMNFVTNSDAAIKQQYCVTGAWTAEYMFATNISMSDEDWDEVIVSHVFGFTDDQNQLFRFEYAKGIALGLEGCDRLYSI